MSLRPITATEVTAVGPVSGDGIRDRAAVSFEFATLLFAAGDDFEALLSAGGVGSCATGCNCGGCGGDGNCQVGALPAGRLMRCTSHAVPLTDATVRL
jgi:hypothetical protein